MVLSDCKDIFLRPHEKRLLRREPSPSVSGRWLNDLRGLKTKDRDPCREEGSSWKELSSPPIE